MSVHKLMTRDVTTVRSEAPISDAARIPLSEAITGAPVVYEDGRVVIVSRREPFAGREIDDPGAQHTPVHDEGEEPPHDSREVMARDPRRQTGRTRPCLAPAA